MENEYPAVTIDNAAGELNRLHIEIEQKLRTTVQDAIRAGEILSQVKDQLGHGEFLPWIGRNCEFTNKTAESYMKLNRHASKIETVSNLQDAYREVAQIESREKRTEGQKARERVKHYLKTGEKPEGWRRGTDDKLAEDERKWEERREKMEQDFAQRDEERRAKREDARSDFDFLGAAADKLISEAGKRQAFKQRIRLSQSGESDAFVDALMDYLEELEDDNRRIEACQNIIKVCRNIATDLQREG